MFLTLHVDDILLARNNLEMMKATKNWLFSVFEMKNMRESRYVLGAKIIRDCPKKFRGMSQDSNTKRPWNDFECIIPNL